MYELKTKETDNSVIEFIENVENLKKREDAYRLLDLFTKTTGYTGKMWGPSKNKNFEYRAWRDQRCGSVLFWFEVK